MIQEQKYKIIPPVPPPLPLVELSITFLQNIVPPRALAESQGGIILYIFRQIEYFIGSSALGES